MSSFNVTLESIATSTKHPNADRLTICTLEGMNFQFVTQRDSYKPGDKVLYFPVDSVLPSAVIEKLGLSGLLAGPEKNRIKTISLRGAISQGVVCPPEVFYPDSRYPIDIAKNLGITKYDPPIRLMGDYSARPINAMGISVFDIEGADRYVSVLAELERTSVYISEKIEGMNVAVQVDAHDDMRFAIRTLEIIGTPEKPTFLRQVVTPDLEKKIRKLKETLKASVLTLRGELIGPAIQGNYYGLKQLQILFFDILADGKYLNSIEFLNYMKAFELPKVPMLAFGNMIEGYLYREGVSSIKEASNFKSMLNPQKHAEGLVIRPAFAELKNQEVGRLILKQRSPVYLAAEK